MRDPPTSSLGFGSGRVYLAVPRGRHLPASSGTNATFLLDASPAWARQLSLRLGLCFAERTILRLRAILIRQPKRVVERGFDGVVNVWP